MMHLAYAQPTFTQSVWTQIRSDKTLGMIWIQTAWQIYLDLYILLLPHQDEFMSKLPYDSLKGFGILGLHPPGPHLRTRAASTAYTNPTHISIAAAWFCIKYMHEFRGGRSLDPLKITSYTCKQLDPPPPGNSWVLLEHLKRIVIFELWAATCNFQQCCILKSVNSDEPVQPPFKLRNSKWCSFSSLTLIEYSSD